MSIGDVSVTEGNSGTKSATFTVRLSAASSTPVTVQFAAGTSQGPGTGNACEAPIGLAELTNPTVVGTGTPASCTETALRTAVASGGVITFNCGPDPVTIAITQTINLRNDVNTVIDGGGKVTLDAGKRTRHFYFSNSNWMVNTTTVTLQRLVLRNGKAPAGTYYPPDPTYPKCAYGYKEGSGGAVYMRDGVLHVIDCEFYDNEAALLGPDVGGGALYLLGVRGVVIVNSRFARNSAANGGAVGMLFANPQIYNSIFEDNTAVGVGMNYVEPECPKTFGHENQGGAGGLSGAVYFDGMDNDGQPYTICGSVFRNNRCNELGGALFRTPNVEVRQMVIDRSLFQGNTARGGGVSFIKQNDVTVRESLFTGNRGGRNVAGEEVGGWAGGLWVNEGTLNLVNTTFYDNSPGGLDVEGTGTVRNATFVDSELSSGLSAYNSVFRNVSCETTTGSKNVQYPMSGTCPSGTVYADPKLAGLADNGGPTQTMMPATDSPVLGVGTGCPATDQRGNPRSASGCDAGAVER
jgi:Right handed beta helix region